jgi:hypothetical protein
MRTGLLISEPSASVRASLGPYEHPLITGGVGHNLPQETSAAFAQAAIGVAQ